MIHGSWRLRWQHLVSNRHVCAECNALVFLLLAIGSALAGLHVAPVLFLLLALSFCSSDLYDWWRERH